MNRAGEKSSIQGKRHLTKPMPTASPKEAVESEVFLRWHLWNLSKEYSLSVTVWFDITFLKSGLESISQNQRNQDFSKLLFFLKIPNYKKKDLPKKLEEIFKK